MKRAFPMLARGASKTRFGICLAVCFLAAGQLSDGAPLRSARVSAVIRDVRLLPSNAAPRPAAVNENVGLGTAVRTGVESRAELTFADLTVTRLGENTIFSFNEAAREVNVTKGAILLEVPSKAPAAKITTAGVTAGVMGATALFATGPPTKFMMLEGIGTFYPTGHPERTVTVHAGEMVMMTADGRITQPAKFNVQLVLQTSHLIVDFSALANLPLILQVINQQLAEQSTGTANPLPSKNSLVDVIDVLSQNVTANPAIVAPPVAPGPPVITSSVPYIINNGTVIATHPTITTNGVTDTGVLYRGRALDGPLSAFIFGSTSAFDTASGFDIQIAGNNAAAGFKFTSLQLAGNPTINTTNGPIDLGLIAVNGITSGAPGGTITFAGLKGVLLATQKGSINLGPEISFSGLHDLNIYARGSNSDLTLGSDISTTSKVRLFAQRDMSVTSSITTDDLYAFVGSNVTISGPAVIHAPTITLSAGQNLTWNGQTSDETAVNSSGDVTISAGQAINIANGLNIIRHNGMVGSGLNVSLSAGTDLLAANNLAIQVDNSMGGSLDTGGNVTLNSGGNLTVNGSGGLTLTVQNTTGTINNGGNITLMVDGSVSTKGQLSLLVENYDETVNPAGHIGTGGNISVTTGGNLTADSISAFINNRAGGVIDSGANLTVNIGGALTTLHNGLDSLGNPASLSLGIGSRFDNNTAGSFIGGDATLLFHSDTASIGGILSVIVSDRGGTIDGNALLNFSVTHDMTVQGADTTNQSAATWQILNDDGPPSGSANPFGGTIHGSATLQLSATNLTVPAGSLEVDILNKNGGVAGSGGTIDSDANITFNLTGNLTTQGSLLVQINNSNIGPGSGGVIGSSANITLNIAGNLTTQTDATFQIQNAFPSVNPGGSGGMIGKNAVLNLTANSVSVGGTFDTSIRNARNAGTAGGNIGGSAILNLAVTGIMTAHRDLQLVNNGGGTIGSDASITVNAGSLATTDTATGALSGSIANAGSSIGNGSSGGGATIKFGLTGALTSQSDAFFSIDNSGSGTIAGDAAINLSAASISSVGGFFDGIENFGSGRIGSGSSANSATINLGLTGALISQSFATFAIQNQNGGTIAANAAITLNAANTSSVGVFFAGINNSSTGSIGSHATINFGLTGALMAQSGGTFSIQNQNGGTIAADAGINLSAANISSGGVFFAGIQNTSGGRIGGGSSGGGATINLGLTGALISQSDATFSIDNSNGGSIGSDATVTVNAGSISTAGNFFEAVNNTGGTIGGIATINMNVSGSANVTNNATFQILGSAGVAKGAAINFNGGSYGVGGTFFSTIDGDGAITFNNASLRADTVKVGVFGNNGTLTIGGGAISANTLLKLYAPGSNGTIDFVANVTLSNQSSAVLIAANKVMISNGVVVTIGGGTSPASVFTNIANYTGSGGNGSTTGMFGGNGATTSPLSSAPPFGAAPSSSVNVAQQPAQGVVQGERTIGNDGMLVSNRSNRPVHSPLTAGRMPVTNPIQASSAKGGNPSIASGRGSGAVINVANSGQLLDLLDNAAPAPGGKIAIPASNRTSHSKNSSRINADRRLKADGGTIDARHARGGADNPRLLASARSFAP